MAIAPQQDQFEDIDIHPAATIFPMMDGLEYELFKADIEVNGQIEPVVFWCGQLLDGRNRYRACREIDKEPWTIEIPEEIDPWKFVISHNLHRRHLSETQRAMVAARLANLELGDNQHTKEGGPIGPPSISNAAEQLSVSPNSVKRAKKVLAKGSKELIEACDKDRVAVSKAAKAATQTTDPKEQNRLATHDQAPQHQAVKDSESSEIEAIVVWVRKFETFQNQLAALKQLFSSLDSQVIGLVRHLVEVVDDD